MLAGTIPESQALADCLIAAGYVGMKIQSFAVGADTNDLNLVMWRWGASGLPASSSSMTKADCPEGRPIDHIFCYPHL